MIDDVSYEVDPRPDPDELARYYARQHHPTSATREQLARMLDETFCFVSARRHGRLVGFARGQTDGLVGRLVECKLDPEQQGPACVTRKDGRIEHDESGIARQMARRVIDALRAHGAERIDVTAYGTEVDFCEELGFQKLPGMVAMGLALDAEPAEAVVAVGASAPAGGAD